MEYLSNLLFSNSSFLDGLAQTLDIGDTYITYNSSDSAESADITAMQSDWHAVGNTIKEVMFTYETK